MLEKAKLFLPLLLLSLLAAAIIDCAVGKTRYCPGIVREHVYKPPQSSVVCSQDKDGMQHCHTTYDPAEYHLLTECQNPEHVANISTSMTYYALIRNGDQITVGERCGRWTKIVWTSWVESRDHKADY